MLVGTKNIPYSELAKHASSVESLCIYSEELVPRIIRHKREVVNNQKYLVALTLRKIQSIPFYTRQELCEGLLKGVSLTGVTNTIFDLDDVLSNIDIDSLVEVLFNT